MDTLCCVILDDEPLAVKLLSDYIHRTPGLSLTKAFFDPLEALVYLEKNIPDVLFLDVEMPGLSGIQVMKVLAGRCPVVMTTAYPQFAIDGFEYNALDYLLKPVSLERFLVAVRKVKSHLEKQHPSLTKSSGDDAIFIKSGYKTHRIALSDIYYLRGLRDYVSVQLKSGKLLTQQSMRSFEEIMPRDQFVRIHKSYIVALQHIAYVERNRVYINDTPIPVGETYREIFQNRVISGGR
ncbi:MAG: response regulator transcription factor [Flavobacteriales bacterium]|nr:response regulator transcription factor [Flavobacteriales bacterium]